MAWWNFFSEMEKIKCPDGTTRIVYKNIDKAMPLYIKGLETGASINIDDLGIDLNHKSKVDTLLIGLDEDNNGTMMSFRAAYFAYKTNPCDNDKFFLSEIEKINHSQRKLKTNRMQILSFIEMLKVSKNENSSTIIDTYNKLISSMTLPEEYSSQIVANKIEEAIEDAKTLSGGDDES